MALNKIFLPLLIICVLPISRITAQNNFSCENKLIKANKNYETGHFDKCVDLILPCIKKLDKELRIEAYRLLAMSHIQLLENDKAEKAVVLLLKAKPDYKEFPYVDPLELTKIISRYDVWPMFEFGMKVGININQVNPLKNYSLTNSPAVFNAVAGYQSGVYLEYFPSKKITAIIELQYEGLNYSRTANDVSGWKQEYVENLTYFCLPVAARYYGYSWKDFQFGVEAGLQFQLLNTTNSNISLIKPTTGELIQNTTVMEKQRNKHVYYLLGGLVAKYKLGNGHIAFNARYAYGLNNIVIGESRYENLNFILANQYVDSDIKFNPLYLSLSYQFHMQSLYTVKKNR